MDNILYPNLFSRPDTFLKLWVACQSQACWFEGRIEWAKSFWYKKKQSYWLWTSQRLDGFLQQGPPPDAFWVSCRIALLCLCIRCSSMHESHAPGSPQMGRHSHMWGKPGHKEVLSRLAYLKLRSLQVSFIPILSSEQARPWHHF